MRVGVPGEFHEDRWQRTAEESERRLLPRTREAEGAHRIQVIAFLSVLLTGHWHGDLAHKYLSAILAWQDCLEPVSNRSLADAPAGLRHGHPTHRYSSAISAWRDHLLSTLLSRDPAHRHSSAISSWRSSLLSVHSSMKWALFVDVEVWIGCSSMKWVLFVDVEVRIGCSSMKWALFVDVEVRSR